MNRSRWASASAAVATMGLLAACSSTTATTTTPAGTTSAAATAAASATTTAADTGAATTTAATTGGDVSGDLTFSGLTSDKDPAEATIAAFMKKYPNVKVNATFADVSAYQQAIRTQLASGTAADVFFVWPGNGNPAAMQVLQKNNLIADLSSMSWASKTPAGLDPVSKIDGKTYVAITGINGIGAIYNQAALDKVGLKPPTTWTELLQFCKDAKVKGTPAFALGNQTDWVTQLIDYALSATVVYQKDPKFAAEMAGGQKKFVGSDWDAVMSKYLEMNTAGCFQDKPLGTSVDATIAMVGKGQALGVVQGNWELSPLIKAAAPGTKFVMKALPATDNAADTWMAAAGGGSYGMNVKPKNEAAAKAFMEYLMSDEGISTYVGKSGSLPSIASGSVKTDPALQALADFNAQNKTAPFMDQLWPNAKVQQAHLVGVADLFGGKAKPADVLAKMDAAYAVG